MIKKIRDAISKRVRAAVLRALQISIKNRFNHEFTVECIGPDGKLKWTPTETNIIVNAGLNDIISNYWKGAAYTASHYVGLMSGTPTVAAADTMASHAGWTEVTAYTEANRQALVLGAVAAQSVDNSASRASFAVNADATSIGGPFIATDNTKGGTSGVLVGAAAFNGGNKTADNGDTLNVTVTLTASSS